MNKIAILGSTGSIGTQTLEVALSTPGIDVVALAADRNIDLLEQQIRKFKPHIVAVNNIDGASMLRTRVADTSTKIVAGMDGVREVATLAQCDTVVTSMVGAAGLVPTLDAIQAKKTIALANKETLVAAGEIVMAEAKRCGVDIIPVDSEHSAIFQCLQGRGNNDLKRIILTASGGPFFGYSREKLARVTVAQALKHPNWAMGGKITIDSATMMNKGLEAIEAMWLFDVGIDDIDIVIHRESIIHSMIEYIDNSVIAQMGTPDMRLPIQYALTYPARVPSLASAVDFTKMQSLTFAVPDESVFDCLQLARSAAKAGGTMPAVLNAANEVAVMAFLAGKINFLGIAKVVRRIMALHGAGHGSSNALAAGQKGVRVGGKDYFINTDILSEGEALHNSGTSRLQRVDDNAKQLSLDDVLSADAWARDCANEEVIKISDD